MAADAKNSALCKADLIAMCYYKEVQRMEEVLFAAGIPTEGWPMGFKKCIFTIEWNPFSKWNAQLLHEPSDARITSSA